MADPSIPVRVSAGGTGTRFGLAELVAQSGVPASTIHHYRRRGLVPPLESGSDGRPRYDERHLRALRIIRRLRCEERLSLGRIAVLLPGLLAGDEGWSSGQRGETRAEDRLVRAAIRLFSTEGYTAVSVEEIAAAASMAKGTVYRYFSSKDALFQAVVERLCQDTAERFARAVEDLGGPAGVAYDPQRTAWVFAQLVARPMPILLELGARAAQGDDRAQELARQVLRTLADAAGRPLSDDPIPAGLSVIEAAFATVLHWAVGTEWPPRDQPDGDATPDPSTDRSAATRPDQRPI
jgi:AcrR family transcriptional regulator